MVSTGAPMSGRGPVEVHIDRLVLEGVPPEHQLRLVDALRAELTRLASEPAPWTTSVTVGSHAETAPRGEGLTPGAVTPEAVGAAVAAAIWRARG